MRYSIITELIASMLLLHLGSLSAQDFDSYKRQQQDAFRVYRQKTQEEWDAYRRKVNAEFAEYLEMPWEEKKGESPKDEPVAVPDVPPVVFPELEIVVPEYRPIDVEVTIPTVEDEPLPVAPIPYRPKPAEKTISFTFYGSPGRVRFDMAKLVSLKGTDEKAVSRFWAGLSGESYDNVVADCLDIRNDRDLCDWAYYKMCEQVAQTLYTDKNGQSVFLAWLLAQSGFANRLGRENGRIHLLLGTSTLVYGRPYWKLGDGYYSLYDGERITSMHIMDATFPNTSPLRMRMRAFNRFDGSGSAARSLRSDRYPAATAEVVCDNNLLAFMQDVPISAIEGTDVTDFLKYADVYLSELAADALYRALRPQIEGKTEAEAANILLNFVQTAFEYKTDGETWGRERPFFPEETLYYPFCDCEDRAILFCRMIRDLMALETAFVVYPGHLAAAVHFTEDIPGDYFTIDGKRFLVCDPTYINAPIGETMRSMSNRAAQVFLWD